VQADPDAESGRRLIERSISRVAAVSLSPAEIEAVRGRIVALPALPSRPKLKGMTSSPPWPSSSSSSHRPFPVVLPFLLIQDVAIAKVVSRVLTLTMLFIGGLALGRHAGYGAGRPDSCSRDSGQRSWPPSSRSADEN
jgi:hypothetical protein